MTDLSPKIFQLAAFTIASCLLSRAPGPGALYTVSQSRTKRCHTVLISANLLAIGNRGNANVTSFRMITLRSLTRSAIFMQTAFISDSISMPR